MHHNATKYHESIKSKEHSLKKWKKRYATPPDVATYAKYQNCQESVAKNHRQWNKMQAKYGRIRAREATS